MFLLVASRYSFLIHRYLCLWYQSVQGYPFECFGVASFCSRLILIHSRYTLHLCLHPSESWVCPSESSAVASFRSRSIQIHHRCIPHLCLHPSESFQEESSPPENCLLSACIPPLLQRRALSSFSGGLDPSLGSP